MKTTGIIRRIDELGRIVIPKEIRKNLRIKNGESLEIYLENDSIILKKYSQSRWRPWRRCERKGRSK